MTTIAESERIDAALERLYREHDLPPDGGAHDAWFHVRVGPVNIPLPNPPARREAVLVHDVNHILTGYDATFSVGEMSIAAFEVGTGCGRVWVAWFLNLALLALGAIVRPVRVFRAFVRGSEARSLYVHGPGRDALRAMTVGDVRRLMALDARPAVPRMSHALRYAGWVLGTWAIVVTPLVIVLVGVR